jgi:hypothetical protein
MINFFYVGYKTIRSREHAWGYYSVSKPDKSETGVKKNIIFPKSAELYAISQALSHSKKEDLVIFTKNRDIVNDYNFNLEKWIKFKQNVADIVFWRKIYELKTPHTYLIYYNDKDAYGYKTLDAMFIDIKEGKLYAQQHYEAVMNQSNEYYNQGAQSIYIDSSSSIMSSSWSSEKINELIGLKRGGLSDKLLAYFNANNISYESTRIPNGVNITSKDISGYVNFYNNGTTLASDDMQSLIDKIKSKV